MTLRTGLIITGDTDGAQKALNDLAIDMNKTGTAAKQLGDAETIAEKATESLGGELRKTGTAAGTVAAELERAGLSVAQLTGSIGGLDREAQRLTIAEKRLEAAALAWAAAQERAAAATSKSADEQQAAAGALAAAEARLAAAKLGVVEAQQRAERSGGANVRSMGEQALGARMLGQQVQDMGLMISMSGFSAQSVLRAFSVQAGQTALAVEQMGVGGAIGKTAAFLGSPWGAVILSATMVLGPFVAQLLDAKKEATELADNLEKAAKSADSFGNAQSLLGKIIDLNTGKFKTQNTVLRETIRLQAEAMLLKGQQDEKAARDKIGRIGTPGLVATIGSVLADNPGAGYGGVTGSTRQQSAMAAETAPLRQLRNEVLDGGLDATAIRKRVDGLAQTGALAKYTAEQIIALKQELYTLPQARNDQAAARMAIDAVDGKGVADPLKPYSAAKPKKPRKPKSTEARDEFGRDTADRIASITEAFNQTPPAVQQADKAVRQLDDIIDDLGRKRPPNFEALIVSAKAAKQTVESGLLKSLSDAYKAPETLAQKAVPLLDAIDGRIRGLAERKPLGFEKLISDAQAARGEIEDGINRPFTDFMRSQEQSLAITALQLKGQNDQAEALRTIYGLEQRMGPLRTGQKDAILASVQALRAQQREVEILRQNTQKYLTALGSIEGIVRDASQAFVRGDLGQLIMSPGKLLDTFATVKGQKLFDDLFSGVFRDLQDQVNGTSIIKDASTRMAASVDQVTASTGRTTQALDSLARSAAAASDAVGTGNRLTGKISLGTEIGDAVAAGLRASEIVVTSKRQAQLTPEGLISKAVGGVATSIASVFSSPETAKNIGGAIGKVAGKGLEGAATGSMVAGLGNALGIKMNTTGAQVGGAIGKFIPIPGGNIIGSVLGGLVGNLFKSTPRGSAQITSVDGKANVSGNSAEIKADLGNLAGSVQGAIGKIAQTLGAEVGSFAVSINKYKDSYRVDPSGGTSVGGKYGDRDGVLKFDNDPEGAVRAAISNAISDGAIKGLSGAVQKALRSSPDIDKALQEALKVGNVEQLLGGLPAELTNAFKSFEKEAADRLRIARDYGFDIVKTEELNAKQRATLTEQLGEKQFGSLKRLIDEMTSGSLFEGSAVDRRTALLGSIDKAQADVKAGVEGAVDKLASLYEQLNSVSKDVYGTTGGFAVDRAAIIDQARAEIAKQNSAIQAAQQRASDPALATTNKALDESNDLNAKGNALSEEMLAELKKNNALLASRNDASYLRQLAGTAR